jgi:peptidoglycan/LPS O-acetylase OafA/YrhL
LLLGGRVSYAAYLLQFPVWTYVDRMAYGTFKNRFPPCSRHDPEAAASWTDCFAKSGYQEWPDVMVVWNVFLLFAVAYVVNRYYETKMVAFLARKMLAPRKEEGKAEPNAKRTGGGGAE